MRKKTRGPFVKFSKVYIFFVCVVLTDRRERAIAVNLTAEAPRSWDPRTQVEALMTFNYVKWNRRQLGPLTGTKRSGGDLKHPRRRRRGALLTSPFLLFFAPIIGLVSHGVFVFFIQYRYTWAHVI
jgi:hypothetical protein